MCDTRLTEEDIHGSLHEASKGKASVSEELPTYNSEKALRRERHLELLVLHFCDAVEQSADQAFFDTAAYASFRELFKSLCHNRRPDGSKY